MRPEHVLDVTLGALPLGVALYDTECRYVQVNQTLADMNGVPVGEHVGRTPTDVLAIRGPAIEQRLRLVLAGEPAPPLYFHAELPPGAGRERSFETRYSPVSGADGRIAGVLAVVVEATEREATAARLRASEELNRAILETVVDGVLTIDAHGTIHSVNTAVERIFGYAPAELVGQNLTMLMPEGYRDRYRVGLARYLATGQAEVIGRIVRVEGCRKDGGSFPLSVSVSEMWLGGERMFTGVVRDVTEEVRAETALREANAALDRMLAMAPRFHRGGSPEQVAGAVCHAAVETFGCDAASLWQLEGEEFRLVRRVPPSPLIPEGTALALGEVAGFRAQMAAGTPWFVDDLEAQSPDAMARFGRAVGAVAQVRMPLASPDASPDALLMISWRRPIDPPSPATLALAQRFADLASLAVVEAHRRQAQASVEELYARFGQSLLPRTSVADPSVRCLVRYLPGEARLQLGGDFVDAVERADGTVGLLIGDVAGHGPDAAALGASLRAAWRGLSLAGADLHATLMGLNAVVLREEEAEAFATVACVIVSADRRSLTLVSAGHPPPVLLTDELSVPIVPAGVPLGVAEQARWEALTVAVPPRWGLLLYTDGLIEGRAGPTSEERYGQGRLLDRLGAEPVPAAIGEAAIDRVVADVAAAHGGALPDDIAILLAAWPADEE